MTRRKTLDEINHALAKASVRDARPAPAPEPAPREVSGLDEDTREALAVIWLESDSLRAAPAVQALNWLETVRGLAKRLRRSYEARCNRPFSDADESREERLETAIRAHFAGAGLGLYLNGDPRGAPVGILTPKSGRYNTMGGAESGWRL